MRERDCDLELLLLKRGKPAIPRDCRSSTSGEGVRVGKSAVVWEGAEEVDAVGAANKHKGTLAWNLDCLLCWELTMYRVFSDGNRGRSGLCRHCDKKEWCSAELKDL